MQIPARQDTHDLLAGIQYRQVVKVLIFHDREGRSIVGILADCDGSCSHIVAYEHSDVPLMVADSHRDRPVAYALAGPFLNS